MQYKVPQDVQREDTIIGPLTLKQMGILGIGGGICYAIYVTLAKKYFMEIWLPPVIVVSAITLAFAFLRIYNLPFHLFLMNFIEYHFLPKKRFWIQGSGIPFISSFDIEKHKEEDKKQELKLQKKQKSIEELTKVLDSHGEEALSKDELSDELSKEEKKEELNKLIKQNYT